MLDVLRMRAAQIVEVVQLNGWSFLLRQLFYLNRTARVVEKDLSEVAERHEPLASLGLRVIEFIPSSILNGTYRFAMGSRGLKALHFLKEGYFGFGLVLGDLVVGDMWYCFSETESVPGRVHKDLQRFGFTEWSNTHVYTFDIYVVPSERRSGVAASFQNNAMVMLKLKGFKKAFGYYWSDNLQAHWCTCVMNKWKRIHSVRVSRFATLNWATPIEGKAV